MKAQSRHWTELWYEANDRLQAIVLGWGQGKPYRENRNEMALGERTIYAPDPPFHGRSQFGPPQD